jgi:hypothetical protein
MWFSDHMGFGLLLKAEAKHKDSTIGREHTLLRSRLMQIRRWKEAYSAEALSEHLTGQGVTLGLMMLAFR